jgi:hypothetical protein
MHDKVLARRAVHAFAQAWLSVLRDQAGRVELGDEIVQIMVGLQNDIAASAAIAAAGAAFGTKRFAEKGHAAFAAMSRATENFNFIYKHE